MCQASRQSKMAKSFQIGGRKHWEEEAEAGDFSWQKAGHWTDVQETLEGSD